MTPISLKRYFRVFVWVNKMILFDTHCHLNAQDFQQDIEGYLSRAQSEGVKYLSVVGWDLASSKKALELATRYPNVFAVIGIHPSDVFKTEENDLKEIEALLSHNKVVALGEIGLDYHWHKESEEHAIQKQWFVRQIQLANQYNLPIVVHMRDASQDTLDILKANPVNKGGIMHCFSSSSEMAQEFIKLGFYISLGGPVTFKNAKEPKRVAMDVPLDRLLIETDSPYLAPHPLRGKLNQSSLLPLILKEIALLRAMDEEKLAEIILANSFNVFHVEQQ